MKNRFWWILFLSLQVMMSPKVLNAINKSSEEKTQFIENWARAHIQSQTSEDQRLILGSVVFASCKDLHAHLAEVVDVPLNDSTLQHVVTLSDEEVSERGSEICAMIGFSVASFKGLKPEQGVLEVFDHSLENEYGFIVQVMNQKELTPEAAIRSLVPDFELDMRLFQLEKVDHSDDSDNDSGDEEELIQEYFSMIGGAPLSWLARVWRKGSSMQTCAEA